MSANLMTPSPGHTIRSLRRAAGLDITALAEGLAVSVTLLQEIENDDVRLPGALLAPLAEMLDAPLPLLTAELYGGGGIGGELQALAENFMAIQHPASREAVLALVFALGDAASELPPKFAPDTTAHKSRRTPRRA